MRILLLACLGKNKSGNVFGGAEKSIVNLANWLADKDYDVVLASVEGDARAYDISDKVKYEGKEIIKKNKLYTHYQLYANTKRVIKKYKPDIIISFFLHPLFYALPSIFKNKIKAVYSERNDPDREYGKAAKLMRKILVKHIDGIVFQTRDAKNYFPDKIKKKSIVIHNPTYIKYDDYAIVENPDKRIVTVGRLNPQKNHKLLIKAFSEISDKYKDYTLEIYGDGPLKNELKSLIRELGMEDKIFLKGTYKDVLNRVYGAGLFVMTSVYEGMPNALIEAMCLGIPVICSDCPCGGPGELIENGKNGYLFKPDDIEQLKGYMSQLLDKYNIDMCLREKEICKTHSKEKIFADWEDYISHIVR
ncbi:MAG: glycosyltransferase [Lachnospiraceae bacterium]